MLIIFILGFCGFTVYHTALSFGEYYVSAGIASLIVSTTTIFAALLATYFLREKFSKIAWIGSIIAFLGVALISLGNGEQFHAMIIRRSISVSSFDWRKYLFCISS
ncbi:Integral membrane protein DUF6 [Staphylococcus xylosus]|uniref:DMT family transporter n=1 Tax=Staphylococcus xylosus TaxID=1288 RepID=UPI000869EE10|nr:Integral membrane protein DUF6 [Staphylococcus xylosus]